MKKIFYFFSILLILMLQVSFAQAQTPYFDRSLDEYNPPLVSDMVPKELLKFKPVSFSFYGSTITELKATTKGGLSRKSDEQEYGKKLHFEWPIKGNLVTLDYYVVSWENAQKYFGGKKVHPNAYAYLKIIGHKINTICSKKGLTVIETNVPEEHRHCSFYANPDNIKTPPTTAYFYIYAANAGYVGLWSYANVYIEVLSSDLDTLKKIGNSSVAKLMGKSIPVEKPEPQIQEVRKEEPKQESPKVRAIAMPSALGDEQSSTAYIPASKVIPARITAQTKPNTPVTFQILKFDGTAYLRTYETSSDKIEVRTDSKGIAHVWFYYNAGPLPSPKSYEIKVSTGHERDIVRVNVGLGLTFSKISALQGAYAERHPLIISIKSSFYPKLPLAVYLSNASEKVWNGMTLGVRLKPEWVNRPSNLPADKVFTGITKITATPVGATSDNVLTAISYSMLDETVYAHTKYAYPAIKMQSDGVHSYRILGELVLTDRNGKDYGRLEEELIQKDVLTIITREQPESALTSLLCAFEATTANQFVMLETIKTIPVFLLSPVVGEVVGGAIDWLTTVTGTLCKINRGEDYEKIFLDLAQFLGGQYLDHLYKPEVFNRMTERMQAAFLVAYGNYKGWDVYKKQREFEELREK